MPVEHTALISVKHTLKQWACLLVSRLPHLTQAQLITTLQGGVKIRKKGIFTEVMQMGHSM